ncbi:hypothetical protein [endosymbiont GvMRE of Glomus versiforme]|uniref:hypothetical protein n=1 Tax=endosymbiont GvMRE of Glomus versiforme TaxID=2039283 RepID=UPI000EDA67FD|nr:hypothetical protein [endosymbiont GvMRE of Glomus versiforme]RHZ37307.1 hypothetical protein GvMRE_I1g668 [endosymbiont GvMRE of Glomus versiforme]
MKNDKKKKQYLVVGLIALTFLLAGFFFFLKSKEKEKQIVRNSSSLNSERHCFNCKKEVLESGDFCQHCGERLQNFQNKQNKTSRCPTKTIKIQKTTSGKYFVNWSFFKNEGDNHSFFEEGKNCFSAEEMPKILTKYQECWENSDWTGWEKELKDNYLLVKERKQGGDSQFHRRTDYEFHPISEANREEKEAEQRKEKHKNEWRTCHKCGKNFCLGTEGSIKKTWPNCDWDNPPKVEYFCGNCTKR